MTRKEKFSQHIFNVLLCLLYCGSIFFAVIMSTTIKVPFLELGVYCFLIVTGFYVLFSFKYGVRIFFLSLLAFAFFVFLKKAADSGLEGVGKALGDFFNHIFMLLSSTIRLEKEYELMVALILCVLLAMFTVIFLVKHTHFFISLFLGMVLFISQIFTGNFKSEVPFLFFLFAVGLVAVKKVNGRYFGKENSFVFSSYRMAGTAAVICLVSLFLANVFPYQDQPMAKIDLRLFDGSSFFKGDLGSFSLNQTGFSEEDKKLGGPVSLNYTKVLELRAPRDIYLIGTVKDVYTGSSWITSDDQKSEYKDDLKINALETVFAMGRQNLADKSIRSISAELKYVNMNTRSVFQPPLLNQIVPGKLPKLWIDRNDKLFCNQYLTNGQTYEFSQLAVSPDAMQKAARKAVTGFYGDVLMGDDESWSTEDSSSYTVDTEIFLVDSTVLETLHARAQNIYERYTLLPDTLPQRVRELAYSITEDMRSPYDQAKAIESYLASNYKYNLNVPETPGNRDFVDYFLFDLNEGYCTYYASSMVVMCRAIGIPARYVEGFGPPVREANGLYNITNAQAHAWVEVYLEGYGWIQMEPTAPYTYSMYGEEIPESIFSPNMLNDPTYRQYIQELLERNRQKEIETTTEESSSETTATTQPSTSASGSTTTPTKPAGNSGIDPSDSEKSNPKRAPTVLLVLASAAVLILLISGRIVSRKKQRERLSALEPKEAVLQYFEEIARLAKYDRQEIQSTETITEFTERLTAHYELKDCDLNGAAHVFEKARYAESVVSPEEKQRVREAYEAFDQMMRKKIGILRFLPARYLAHRI